MGNFTERKRVREWWRESNEELPGNRMTEAYEAGRLKAGSDGKNTGSVTDDYVSKGDRNFDDLGASQGTKTGKSTKVESKKVVAKKAIKEEFDDEPLDGGFEDEVPPDMDDMDMGDDMMGDEAAPGDDISDDIEITIAGQTYKLVPATGGDDMDGDIDSEMDADLDMGDEMEASEDDISQPKMEAKKRAKYDRMLDEAIANTKDRAKKEQAQKILKQKKVLEAKLAELFTGSYVASDGGAKPVKSGDNSFAVTGQAKDGKQYTPTVAKKSVYEVPEEDIAVKSKAPDKQTVKNEAAKKIEAKKAAFKKWLAEQEAQLDEAEDAGQTSVDFSNHDTEAEQIGQDFADMPIEVGADPQTISKYGKTAEARKARRQREEEECDDEDDDKEEMEENISTKRVKESFDYKKLMKGEYK